MAAKSAFLQLFDNESKDDSYSFLVSNKQASIKFEDAYEMGAGRPMEFKSQGGYKYYEGASYYDLGTRFSNLEADVATNAANPVPAQNTQAIADLSVASQAKDSQIEANLTAEISRASTAESALDAKIDGVESDYKAADETLTASIAAESAARSAAVSAEQTRAEGVEASLQQQISNILSNVDPTLIDSISELLAHVNNADASLIAQLATMQSQLDAVQAKLDQLTSE